MSRRAIGRSVLDVVGAIPLFLTAPLYRRWHLRWGATDEEVHAHLPGDEIVTDPSFSATRAITINAPPEQVWPWIVQLGVSAHRTGFVNDPLSRASRRPPGADLPSSTGSVHRIDVRHQQPPWRPPAATVPGWPPPRSVAAPVLLLAGSSGTHSRPGGTIGHLADVSGQG
jgi:hypothetical protein